MHKDITGKRFDKLTAVRLSCKNRTFTKNGDFRYIVLWEFICDCGNTVIRPTNGFKLFRTIACRSCAADLVPKRRIEDARKNLC